MEIERCQGYVASLERTLKNTHSNLREVMEQFQEFCHRVSSQGITPMSVIADIREMYKQIQNQLNKIRGIHHLLEGKYRHYYRRDTYRDKEILEFAFLAKTLYSKFQYTLMEIEAKRNLREKEGHLGRTHLSGHFAWFHSRENQIILLRTLENLSELDYLAQSEWKFAQKRKVNQGGLRSISLFALSGEETLIDRLQSRMRLRVYDVKERLTKDELRGALTHLWEISHWEVEQVVRRFTQGGEFSKLKCLLFPIQTQKDLEKEILKGTENLLHQMGEGEIKTLLM